MELSKSITSTFLWSNPVYLRCFIDIGLAKNIKASQYELSRRWSIPRTTVKLFLDKAVKAGLITVNSKGITLCKEYAGAQSKDTIIQKQKSCEKRKGDFYNSLIPYVETYGKEMVREFFDYWTEMNKTKTKMLFEEKKTFEIALRLKTWSRKTNTNDSSFREAIMQQHRLTAVRQKQSTQERLREIENGEDVLI